MRNKKKCGEVLWLPIKPCDSPSIVIRAVPGNMVTSDYIPYPPLLLSVRHITTFLIKPRVCTKEKQPWILSLLIFVWTGKQECLRSRSNSARGRGRWAGRTAWPARHSTQHCFAGMCYMGETSSAFCRPRSASVSLSDTALGFTLTFLDVVQV